MTVVRWGLIGAGDIVRKRVGPALRDLANCELVSVSRSNASLAEDFAKEFGASKWFPNYREQIADADIDAVYIATPVFLHAEQTIAAANAGKHVLCEKPMALNVEECDRMIAACHANSVKLGIAYYRRFYPAVVRAKEIIENGEIGEVAVAQINAFEYVDLEPDDPRHWFIEKGKSGGGPMIDFGCHRLEVLRNLFGRVERIESLVSNKRLEREVEDTTIASLQFENGTCATVTVTHAAREPQDTLHIYGMKGSIHVPVLNEGQMSVNVGGELRNETLPPAANFHTPLISDFADAVILGRAPQITGEDGREVQSMIEKIYEESGRAAML